MEIRIFFKISLQRGLILIHLGCLRGPINNTFKKDVNFILKSYADQHRDELKI
jgi:hypothetical protein